MNEKDIKTQVQEEDLDWSKFSLTQAMTGMEYEADLYNLDDLKKINTQKEQINANTTQPRLKLPPQ